MITVMILANTELNNIRKAVQSFRLFGNMEISLIIVDIGLTEGLQEWAGKQTDFTYVLLEEKYDGWGRTINEVQCELEINTDLLIMEGGYVLTPGYLSRMMECLYRKENIGAVGGVYNEAGRNQDFGKDIQSYGKAVEIAKEEKQAKGKRAVMLFHGAILWKREALERIGAFDEEIGGIKQTMDDYCIRAIMKGIELWVCSNAFLWKIGSNIGEGEYGCGKDYNTLENKWGFHYFAGSYNKALCWAMELEKKDRISVLEIGCACGATLVEIKNRFPAAEVYGSEINVEAAKIAEHFAQIYVNNIENKNLPFSKGKFDYILFGDVLEHLHDPLDILRYCKEFLCEEGIIVATIPNVMHISVVEQLIQGNFTYTEVGLLDKTHIHMFTYNEIVRMFQTAGYEIEIDATTVPISDIQKKLIDNLLFIENRAERFMYEAYQYIVKAKIAY